MNAARLAGTVSLALLAVLALACRTRLIPAPQTIPVPMGLSLDGVRTAIVLAASYYEGEPPQTITITPRVWAPGAVGKVIGGPLGPQWYPEREEPGRIYAAYHKDQHTLHVAIGYTQRSVEVEIAGSEHLNQSDERIHKAAIYWIRDLVERIRVSLVRAAVPVELRPDP